jgi:hypothetical protein
MKVIVSQAQVNSDLSVGLNLGAQLGVSALLVIAMVLIHAIGILTAYRVLSLRDDRLRAHDVDVRALGWLIAIGLWLFTLHMIEILVFALFYMQITPIDLESALFFSTSAYSTLGDTGANLPDQWRLVGAIEGLIGFLLIAWSTAVFITDMSKVLHPPGPGEDRDRQ